MTCLEKIGLVAFVQFGHDPPKSCVHQYVRKHTCRPSNTPMMRDPFFVVCLHPFHWSAGITTFGNRHIMHDRRQWKCSETMNQLVNSALSDLKWWANVNFSGSQVICRLCYWGSTLAWLPWLSWLGYCSLLLLTLVSWQVWHELGELYIEAPPPRVLRWESSASPAMNTNPTWTSIYV